MTDFEDALAAARGLLADAKQLEPPAKLQAIRFVAGLRGKLKGDAKDELDKLATSSLGISRERLKYWLTLPDKDLLQAIAGGLPVPDVATRIPGGWLRDYLAYTANHESPTQFHFWVGVSVVSAAIGRKLTFDKGYYHVVPNHYIVLVAPAGRCRRSVATRIGIEILAGAEATTILREKVTPEGLIQNLSDTMVVDTEGTTIKRESRMVVHAPELSAFLGRQQYNEGMIALLTTLYDSPDGFDYITRTHDKITLFNV